MSNVYLIKVNIQFFFINFSYEVLFLKEINNVRINLFNLITRPKIELPIPKGEKKIFQEKIFIPIQQYPDVSFY